MTVDQHPPLDIELVDVGKRLPKWLPALDIDPGFHIDSGEFEHVPDPALREAEETP